MDKDFSDRLLKIEKVLNTALPDKYCAPWKAASFANISENVTDFHLDGLAKPCKNLMTLGGKRWRPLLLVLCAELAIENLKNEILNDCEQDELKTADVEKFAETKEKILENAYHITPLVEFVHTASLIHDDIEDGADIRRGKAAAHITYGIDTAINAASWLYFEAPVCINTLNAPERIRAKLYELYTQELRRLHLGQAMDIAWHRNPSLFPSIEEYSTMVQLKTGTLASLASQSGILVVGDIDCKKDKTRCYEKTKKSATDEPLSINDYAMRAGKIASQIGMGFQILDDVQNLTTGNPGKIRGDDIVEGKKSLPVLLHIQKNPSDKELIAKYMEQARKEGIKSSAVEKCIALLESSKVIQEAFEQGLSLVTTKSKELASLYGKKDEKVSTFERLFTSMLPKVKEK